MWDRAGSITLLVQAQTYMPMKKNSVLTPGDVFGLETPFNILMSLHIITFRQINSGCTEKPDDKINIEKCARLYSVYTPKHCIPPILKSVPSTADELSLDNAGKFDTLMFGNAVVGARQLLFISRQMNHLCLRTIAEYNEKSDVQIIQACCGIRQSPQFKRVSERFPLLQVCRDGLTI